MKKIGMYLYNWMVLLSKLVNTMLGGTPHESSSQKIGRKYYIEKNKNYKWITNFVNALFFWEDNHILDSLDGEDNSKDIWDS